MWRSSVDLLLHPLLGQRLGGQEYWCLNYYSAHLACQHKQLWPDLLWVPFCEPPQDCIRDLSPNTEPGVQVVFHLDCFYWQACCTGNEL
jgi:hypothetical protein